MRTSSSAPQWGTEWQMSGEWRYRRQRWVSPLSKMHRCARQCNLLSSRKFKSRHATQERPQSPQLSYGAHADVTRGSRPARDTHECWNLKFSKKYPSAIIIDVQQQRRCGTSYGELPCYYAIYDNSYPWPGVIGSYRTLPSKFKKFLQASIYLCMC